MIQRMSDEKLLELKDSYSIPIHTNISQNQFNIIFRSAESIYIPQIEKLQGEIERLKEEHRIEWENGILFNKQIAQLTAKQERLVKVAEGIAAIAHHGGLLGFITETKAMTEIRKITLPYWDKDEADRLQQEAIKKLTEEGNV